MLPSGKSVITLRFIWQQEDLCGYRKNCSTPICFVQVVHQFYERSARGRAHHHRCGQVLDEQSLGSTANELLQAIKYLKLVKESGEANASYELFVRATDEERGVMMRDLIREAYPYIWSTPGFDLERATSAQMADVFRGQNVNGSTSLARCAFLPSGSTACWHKGLSQHQSAIAP